jgi:hypothetical protein
MTRRAPVIPDTISSASFGGVISSLSPAMTTVGQRICANDARQSRRLRMAFCWRTWALRTGLLGHQLHLPLEPRVITRFLCTNCENAVRRHHPSAPVPPSQSACGEPRFARERSARADVSSSASPLWCLAEHLRGDIATHGEPDQRESRRRRAQDTAGNGVHGFVPTVIRNRDRAKRPKRRNLIGIKVAPST